MHDDWRPPAMPAALGDDGVRAMMALALPDAVVTGWQRLSGGFSNLGFRVECAGRGPVHLRLWSEGGVTARMETALLGRLGAQGRVPVARVLAAPAAPDPATGRPFAVLEWVAGVPLAGAAAGLPPPATAALGRAAGRVLADIHALKFPACGFFSESLELARFWPCGAAGYQAALDRILAGPAGRALEPDERRRLVAFGNAMAGRLEGELRPPCLVHGDFGPGNILVAGPQGPVAAVIDWEFAFAADPLIDIANIMRPPLGERPGFAAGFTAGYRAGGGSLPADWRRLALITDLPAWVAHLGHGDPARTRDARARIAAILAAFGHRL
ncbi:phosphotransferase [Pseudoxanthobacter sp.]|uniref:phosphotransferase family protein n=1 Tax=Pseudoxanthobacter sp. TaxID=1925742 RepID=UPI002FE200A4